MYHVNEKTEFERTHGESSDILQTAAEPLQQLLKRQAASSRSGSDGPRASETPTIRSRLRFRPVGRQPLAILTILDDGQRERGEEVRIRRSSVVIGRTKGDVRIPFDLDISSTHAELRCRVQNGRHRWYLIDKTSRNGTFVRAFRASLFRDTELILGGRRYQFQLPKCRELDDAEPLRTQAYQAPSKAEIDRFVPRLIEQGIPEEQRATYAVNGAESKLGTDGHCPISIADDPFLSPQHARFYMDHRRRWMIEDLKSTNGIWIRIRQLPLEHTAEFQLGQQRFRFQPAVS